MICNNCGAEVETEDMYCTKCGKLIVISDSNATMNANQKIKSCIYCREMIPEDSIFCPLCGRDVSLINISNVIVDGNVKRRQRFKWKNKWVSLFLCVFLGWLGAHKYYEGRFVVGIIYTLTLGILGWGWVFDIIGLLRKPNPYRVL